MNYFGHNFNPKNFQKLKTSFCVSFLFFSILYKQRLCLNRMTLRLLVTGILSVWFSVQYHPSEHLLFDPEKCLLLFLLGFQRICRSKPNNNKTVPCVVIFSPAVPSVVLPPLQSWLFCLHSICCDRIPPPPAEEGRASYVSLLVHWIL